MSRDTFMKHITTCLLAFALSVCAIAAEKTAAGPKGGRLLDTMPHKTEFVVTGDRRVEIHVYDPALQPVAPGELTVSMTAEPKTGRLPVAFEKTATGFVSKFALPESAEPYRVVVQVRESAGARPQNFRIDLNLALCAECDRAEYACVCESH